LRPKEITNRLRSNFWSGTLWLPAAFPQSPEILMLRCLTLATISLLAAGNLASAQTAPGESSPPASSPAVESPSTVEPMEDPQTGDHWTYELRDDITGDVKSTIANTVTDVSANEIGIRSSALGSPGFGFQTFDRSWNVINNNGTWRFTPNDGTGIRAPLSIGKSWSIKSTDLNSAAGVSLKRTGTSKVTAKENVTTRAGTFETFKIETSYQTQNSSDPTKKFQIEQQVWYAPAIDHWVKRTILARSEGKIRDKSTIELVEYGRR
jgi:hypothetical protein